MSLYTQQFSPYIHVVHNGNPPATRLYKTYFAVKLPAGFKITAFNKLQDTSDSHILEITVSNSPGSVHIPNTNEFVSGNNIIVPNATYTHSSMLEWTAADKTYVTVQIKDPNNGNNLRQTKVKYSDAVQEGDGG